MEFKTVDDEIMLSDGTILKIPVTSEKSEVEKGKTKLKVEKTPNIWGSSAGAGSDFFDIYRKQRTDEINRTEEMEKKWKEYMGNKLFQEKRKAKMEFMKQKNLKKQKKRLIKKQKMKEKRKNKKEHKKNSTAGSEEENASDNDDTTKGYALDTKNKNSSENKNSSAEEIYHYDTRIGVIEKENIGVSYPNMPIQNESKEMERKRDMNEIEEAKGKEDGEENQEDVELVQKSVPNIDTTNFLVIKEDEIF